MCPPSFRVFAVGPHRVFEKVERVVDLASFSVAINVELRDDLLDRLDRFVR